MECKTSFGQVQSTEIENIISPFKTEINKFCKILYFFAIKGRT